MYSVDGLVEKILSMPRKQSTLIIAIDGVGGSGKSELAKKLKQNLPNSTIVCIDDFYSHQFNEVDRKRLLEQVIKPLIEDKPARYQRYDWGKKKLAEWINIQTGGIVLIEGISTLHDDFNKYYDFRIWIDCSQEIGFERGLNRDKDQYGVDTTNEWLNIWLPQEKEYLESQKPQEKADYIVNHNS